MKSRTKKATLNIVTATAFEIISLICGLILPRLILKYYGSSYNGITNSASQFLSMISILNLGVAGATRAALYKPLADGDIKKTSGIVKATQKHMRRIGIILLLYIIVLSIVYPLVVTTGFSFFDVSILVVATGISSFASYFFGATYQSFLSADQSVYITNIFSIISVLLNTIVSIVLIELGCSIQVVKLGSAFAFCVKPILQNIYVKKHYHLDMSVDADESALNKRGDVMGHSIANIVHENTDVIVLTLFTDVKIVSVYTVYNLVMSALRKMLNIFTTGTESIFGNMVAKGEIEKIKHNLEIYELFIGGFVSVVFSVTLVNLLPFVSLYTSGVYDVEYVLPAYAFVISIAQVFFCFRAPYVSLVQGAGLYKETKNGAYTEAAINLVSSIVLVQFVGIIGTAIGTLLANIFRTVQYALFVNKNIVKRTYFSLFKMILWSALNISLVYCFSLIVLHGSAYNSWLLWIVSSLIYGIMSLGITAITSYIFFRKEAHGLLMIAKNAILHR